MSPVEPRSAAVVPLTVKAWCDPLGVFSTASVAAADPLKGAGIATTLATARAIDQFNAHGWRLVYPLSTRWFLHHTVPQMAANMVALSLAPWLIFSETYAATLRLAAVDPDMHRAGFTGWLR